MYAHEAAPQRPRRFKTGRTVTALILRELGTTYGSSPGGYVWALLIPIGGILLLSFIFGLLLRSPSLGTNFPLFKASGLLIFMMFNEVSGAVAGSLRYSRQLLFYPAVKYTDALIGRFITNMMTQIVVTLILITGIILIYDLRLILRIGPMLSAVAMTGALAAGIGTLNCYLFMAFPAWERFWVILTRPLLLLSCVLFIYEDVPRDLKGPLWYNPVGHVTGEFRKGIYGYYEATYVSPVYVYSVSLVCLTLGLLLLRRHHQSLLNNA